MNDAEFKKWRRYFASAFSVKYAKIVGQEDQGEGTLRIWRKALRKCSLADSLGAIDSLVQDTPDFFGIDDVPSAVIGLADKAASARRVVERASSMTSTSDGYQCDDCCDSGTIDVWVQGDIDYCRKHGAPREVSRHPAIVACPSCKAGKRKYKPASGPGEPPNRWPMPYFDKRVHCLYGDKAQLEAWCRKVQEWAPVQSYDDTVRQSREDAMQNRKDLF
jgi:hypothetical protein